MVKQLRIYVLLLLLGGCASSQQSASLRGYELRIRYAEVTDVTRVRMPSAAPGGAMIGGFTGLILSRNSSSRTRVASGVGGAALGALATRAMEGDNRGYSYTLRFPDRSTSRFVTEKGYLRQGDCVIVEEGQFANVRRVASTLCESVPAQEIETKLLMDAELCHAAKSELLAASTDEALNAAARKVEVLCQY